MADKQQELLDAAISAHKELERWRAIATMMSHFIHCDVRSAECKFCKTAFEVYAEAKEEYAELDNYVVEILVEQGFTK
jgi:hypothetical protein